MSIPVVKVRLNEPQINMIQEAIDHFLNKEESFSDYDPGSLEDLRAANGILQGCWEALMSIERVQKEYEIEF